MSSTEWSDAKRARVEAAARRRRIIFNDDSHELSHEGAGTVEGFLAPRLAALAGTQVDTIAWSVLAGAGDAPSFDSRIQPVIGDAQDSPPPMDSLYCLNLRALLDAGHCPFQTVVDFVHGHGMEAFASVRMNDVHDSFRENLQTRWKLQHPELLVDTTDTLPEFELYVTAQDFTHEGVRRRKFEIIEEICQRYDVDGFELDYIRHPVLFSRRLWGEPCTPDEVEVVTGLMRRIREITDGAAARRGRPILIATRTPDSFARCLDNGMDTQAWLDEDLVDILIAGGGYAPFSLMPEEFVAAARPHGVPVYPCINMGPANALAGGFFVEATRGLAAQVVSGRCRRRLLLEPRLPPWLTVPVQKWGRSGAGATAILRLLNEVGDLASLEKKDKLYCVDSAAAERPLRYYAHVSNSCPLPLESKHGTLRTGVIGRLPLVVGDEIEARRPALATLTVEFDDAAWREVLLFRLNGEELRDGKFAAASGGQEGGTLSYAVSVPSLKSGRNFIEVAARHVEIPESPVKITGARLRIEYGSWDDTAPAGAALVG